MNMNLYSNEIETFKSNFSVVTHIPSHASIHPKKIIISNIVVSGLRCFSSFFLLTEQTDANQGH